MSNIYSFKGEAKREVYELIHKNLRPLPQKPDGSFDEFSDEFNDNEVDALRHAYVSGVYTIEYGENIANLLGKLNEILNFHSSETGRLSENMDLWNNSIGRDYGKISKSRSHLFDLLLLALKRGELITNLEDNRRYKGDKLIKRRQNNLVIVIKESTTGENLEFLDIDSKRVMSKDQFIAEIKQGNYPKYSIRNINGTEVPVSNQDRFDFNNLGRAILRSATPKVLQPSKLVNLTNYR